MPIYREDNNNQVMRENRLYLNKHIKSLSERQVVWVQEYLASNKNIKFAHVGSTDRHEELIAQLASHENFKELVNQAYKIMSYRLVPEENFGWLTNNLRAQIFTLSILAIEYRYDEFNKNNSDLLEEIYLFFDRKNNTKPVSDKASLLDNIHQRWYTVYKNDNYSKWLKKSTFLLCWEALPKLFTLSKCLISVSTA